MNTARNLKTSVTINNHDQNNSGPAVVKNLKRFHCAEPTRRLKLFPWLHRKCFVNSSIIIFHLFFCFLAHDITIPKVFLFKQTESESKCKSTKLWEKIHRFWNHIVMMSGTKFSIGNGGGSGTDKFYWAILNFVISGMAS